MAKKPASPKTKTRGAPRKAAKPRAKKPVVDADVRAAVRKIGAFLVALRPVPSGAEDELRAVEAEMEKL